MTDKKYRKGDWTNCRYDICEIVDEFDDVVCIVATKDVEFVMKVFEEYEQLKHDANVLIEANMKYRKENGELREAMKRMMIDMMDGE